MTQLHDLSGLEQAAAVRAGEVSSVELVEHCAARIAEHDAAVGAVPLLDPASVGGCEAVPPEGPATGWRIGASILVSDPPVAGERPYAEGDPDGTTPAQRHPQVAADPPPLPGRTSSEVVKVVASCLERRPEDRPRPSEVADALQPVLERQPRARLSFKVSR